MLWITCRETVFNGVTSVFEDMRNYFNYTGNTVIAITENCFLKEVS